MALCDAKTLYEAVESGKTLDRKTISSLLSRRNTAQIKAILLSYKQLYGHEFSKSVKNPSRCGQFGRELRVVIRCIQSPEKFFAKQLRMKNADAREMLIRVVVTRSGQDLRGINRALAAKRAGSLENLVRREFVGSSSNKDGPVNEAVAAILIGLIKA